MSTMESARDLSAQVLHHALGCRIAASIGDYDALYREARRSARVATDLAAVIAGTTPRPAKDGGTE